MVDGGDKEKQTHPGAVLVGVELLEDPEVLELLVCPLLRPLLLLQVRLPSPRETTTQKDCDKR